MSATGATGVKVWNNDPNKLLHPEVWRQLKKKAAANQDPVKPLVAKWTAADWGAIREQVNKLRRAQGCNWRRVSSERY